MTNEQQKNIFRMAAIVYGRSAAGVSISKSYQKIVDDALFCCGKQTISLTELIVYINDYYGFLYTPKEILDIVNGRDALNKYFSYKNQDEVFISLTVEYKNKLTLICQEKTLYDYIDEFFANEAEFKNEENRKELILRFLYDMFTSNLEGYKLILKEQFSSATATANFLDEEKAIINAFLNWPNDDKNKAVFDLAGYALEFCMLTNKKNTSLNTQNLKNKSFYIDTNILYRAIGLNGDNLKTRAHLFLSKFKDVGENLVISQSTYVEFVDSIDYYIEKIDKSLRPQLNTNVFTEFIDEDSVYLYYCKWRVGRVERDPSYFKDWIMSEFNVLCDRYHIVRDVKYPFDREDQEKELRELSSSILGFSTDKSVLSASYDAENVMWVEEKRKGSGDDIYQAKAFLLSSDNSLRKWDYQRNSNRVPIVMSPNQWLNIILHYVERTSDDYRSFVSFLTLKIKRKVLPIEKVSLIVTGIAQTTSDIETQQYLVRNFIERKTFDEVDSMSDDELERTAEEYAKTELESRIENLEEKKKESERLLTRTRQALSDTKKEMKRIKKENAQDLAQANAALEAAQQEKMLAMKETEGLKTRINNIRLSRLRGWKIAFGVVIVLLSIFLCLMVFLWRSYSWNFVYQFVQFLDGNKDSVAFSLGQAIVLLPLSILAYGGYMIIDAYETDDIDKFRFFWSSKK